MEIEPIGILRTCFGGKFGVPRQPGLCPSAWGILEFDEKFRFREAVRGLEGFSHLWLIFGFHETETKGWHPTVRPPRLGGNERVGVFASRSTFRPNGLGLSLVKLDRISHEVSEKLQPPLIYLSGVDLVDGTPIYDVKPYLAYAESQPEAAGGYAAESILRYPVEVEARAVDEFSELDERSQKIIREALSLDPRPSFSSKDSGKTYGALFCGRNVRFRFDGETCWITGVARM